jgi:MarR family transcriptional regulator, transcriptional regulator for hemolysin
MSSSKATTHPSQSQPTFGFVLKDTANKYVQRFEERARELGLTLPQCKALVYLARSEGISQVELASSAEIDPMSLVRILDRMEMDGWVERRADPNDRRARRLYLKPGSKPLLEAIDRVSTATRDEALAGFSQQEAILLMSALERVRHNIASLHPIAAPADVEPRRKIARARIRE